MPKVYTVRAFHDDEANVWVAEGENFPGLVTEAASLDELRLKLEGMVPEILKANGLLQREEGVDAGIAIELLAHLQARQSSSR